jgi:F-type H+-transporting ATPase subunit b
MFALDSAPVAMLVRAGVAASEGDRSLGSLLDFSPGATIWTLICFVVGLPLMWKFVYGPITKALEERDRKVEDAIKAAEVARQQAEAQVAAAKTELDKARAEAKRMVDEALARADRQAAEALRAAEERAKAQLDKAREEIEAQKRQALQEIRTHAVDLTIAATGRLLQQDVDDQAHRRMVQEFVATAGGARR